MPRIITCLCGKRLRLPDRHQGKTAQCPACGRTLRLTKPDDEPATFEIEQPANYMDKVVGSCQTCAKPITLRQREKFGYYCNDDCLRRGMALFQRTIPEGAEAAEKEASRAVRRSFLVSAVFIAILGIGLLAYFLFGPHARVRWTHKVSSEVTDIVTSPKLLCFAGADRTLHALNRRSGKPLWQKPLGASRLESILPLGNSCIVATGTTIQALDWKTGEVVWQTELSEGTTTFSSDLNDEKGKAGFTIRYEWGNRLVIPLTAPGKNTVIVLEGGTDIGSRPGFHSSFFPSYSTSSTKKLIALDLATGQIKWHRDLGKVDLLHYSHTDDMIALAVRDRAETPAYALFSLDAANGHQLARIPLVQPSDKSQPGTSSAADMVAAMARGFIPGQPLLMDITGLATTISSGGGRLYIPSGEFLSCAGLKDGTQLWSSYAGKQVSGPIYGRGRIFVAVPAEVLKAVPTEEGSPQDHIRKLLGLDYEEPYFILKCFDADNGKKLWETEIATPRIVYADRAIVTLLAVMRQPASTKPANQEYVLTGYDPETGKKTWQTRKKGVVSTPLTASKDTLYYGAYDLKLSRRTLLGGEFLQEGPMNFRVMALRLP